MTMTKNNVKHYLLPHELFFIIYNIVYIAPVVYVYLFGFNKGGVSNIFSLSSDLLNEMILFYTIMLFSFFCGSRLFSIGIIIQKDKPVINEFTYDSRFFAYLSYFVLFCLLITKLLLIKEGVYDSYAFDSGAMSSKVWTISMGMTELLISSYIIFLFSGHPKNAFICFLGIALNLFHGTRIFTLICIFIYGFYRVYYKKNISGLKLLLFLFLFSAVVIFVFLLVFVHRSDILIDFGSLDFDFFISPLIYESIFNQISFLKMLEYYNNGIVPVAPHMLFLDSMIFTLPNIFEASGDIYISNFGDLSPLGGLSGYASAIIYFSDFYFIWYFMLGGLLSLFLRLARRDGYNILSRFLYIYFLCDSLFRLHRDPYFIVMKMLINNIIFVVFAIGVSIFLIKLKRGGVCSLT